MPTPYRYDVFLCHATADKPAVETLARQLRDAGLKPFLDKWHLIPGQPWQEGLEKALEDSRTVAVFLGPGGLGPWQHEGMRAALHQRVKGALCRSPWWSGCGRWAALPPRSSARGSTISRSCCASNGRLRRSACTTWCASISWASSARPCPAFTGAFWSVAVQPAGAVYVAEQVKSRINRGTPPTRIAVLARNNALLTAVKDALRERRITVRTALNNAFSLQEDAVVAVLGFLHDWVEGKPPHAGTAWVLRNVFGLADDYVRQLEIRALHSAEMHPGDFLDDQRWKDLRELYDRRPHPATLVDATARIFGIDLGEDEDLKSLAAQHRTVSRLLHRVQQGVSSESAQAQGVLVSSFHGSKGLEFDVVFIIACEDGIIPDFRSTSDEALRDERRVLYVAMTRAGNELVITCNKVRKGWERTPCRFLPPRHHRLWTPPPA